MDETTELEQEYRITLEDSLLFDQIERLRGTPSSHIEEVILVAARKNPKQEASLRYLLKNGFYYNGIHYARFGKSASQGKDGITAFVCDSMFDELYRITQMDIPITECIISKYEAQRCLTFSSCTLIHDYMPNIVIIGEYETKIPNQLIRYVEEQEQEFTDPETGEQKTYMARNIKEGYRNVRISPFDGCGCHEQEFMEQVSAQLGLDYNAVGVQIRLPFIKGFSVYFADRRYYEQLITSENRELASLTGKYTALQASRDEAVAAGTIAEGSEAWQKMQEDILDVAKAMEESSTALAGFRNQMRDLEWDIFDYMEDRISQITRESSFLLDLLEEGDLYGDTGAFTGEGMAAAALHGINYNTYLQQSLDYAEELRKLETDLAGDPANKDLMERRENLLKLQQEAITGAQAEKDAIRSLVEDGVKLHLDALSRLIDRYRDSLSAAKDLYDYQKNISQQTETIAGLEKIMLAYQGNDSEEARKLLQDTRNQLEAARQELQETEWDRYISETEDLLDTLYTEYETTLNQRLDNVDALIADTIDMINAGSQEIRETIEAAAGKAGYDISSVMQTIFGSGGSQTTLLSAFMNRFDTASTTLLQAVNDIKNSIRTRITAPAGPEGTGSPDSISGAGGTSGSPTVNNEISASGSPASQTPASSRQGDGAVGIGEQVTFISGRYHEDSWGNGRSGSRNLNSPVYVTKIKADSPYPYHISTGAVLGSGDLGWVKLEQLRGYQSGARSIQGNQWAWTQEDGEELIRTSSGALLTPLRNGDTVFTNKMTQRLWNLASGTIPGISTGVPAMTHLPKSNETPQVVNNSNAITITLPNVTNYTEFKQELQKDNRFIGFVQEVTSGQALGKSKLNRVKY